MAGGRFCPKCTSKGVPNGRWGVDLPEIQRAFTDGGLMAPDIIDLMHDHLDFARRMAPVRTGRLRREHYTYLGSPGGLSRRYYVGTRAEYAKFLLGTKGMGSGFITANDGGDLELRPFPYSYFTVGDSRRWRESVRGQRRHRNADWLAKAAFEAFDWNGLDAKYVPTGL